MEAHPDGSTVAVSVIVPVRNGAEAVRRCLDALAAQVGPSFEVIVVDNASTDDTDHVARAHPLSPRVVRAERLGSYAARNAGLAVAGAQVLAFTDVDCAPEPGWLAAGLRTLESAPADLVGGAIRTDTTPNPTVWEHYDRGVYLRQEDFVTRAQWAATANLFVRRGVIDVVGGFDPTFLSGGDREFCLRAGDAGFRIAYAPDAVVWHQPRTTPREVWRLNKRIGEGMAVLHAAGRLPPWWSPNQHWMNLDWAIALIRRDGPALRRRQVLPVHALAMSARLYGRLIGWLHKPAGRRVD